MFWTERAMSVVRAALACAYEKPFPARTRGDFARIERLRDLLSTLRRRWLRTHEPPQLPATLREAVASSDLILEFWWGAWYQRNPGGCSGVPELWLSCAERERSEFHRILAVGPQNWSTGA
jgi:hypothetical protein